MGRIRQFGGWVWQQLSGGAQALWKTIRREPLSARVVALLGLLLALVSFIEEGFIDRFAKPGDWWEKSEGYVALGLTIALILASAWFSADVRRMKKWSQIADDLRQRVMDVESLHPKMVSDSLAATLESIEDGKPEDNLQTVVSKVNDIFVKDRRIPDLDDIKKLEELSLHVLNETRSQPDAGHTAAHSPEAAAAWESVARLRAATTQAKIELEGPGARPPRGKAKLVDVERDPKNRWTELLALATILIGLIAAPTVADELTGDDRAGTDPTTTTAPTSTDDADDGTADDGTADDGTDQSTPPTTSPLVGGLQAQLANLQGAVAALDGRISATTTTPADLGQGLAGIATQLQQRDDLQVAITIRQGDNLWNLARDVCENNGSAREIAADVISIWNANANTIGANPDELPSEDDVLVNCAD